MRTPRPRRPARLPHSRPPSVPAPGALGPAGWLHDYIASSTSGLTAGPAPGPSPFANPFNPALSQAGAPGTLGVFQAQSGVLPNPTTNPAAAGPPLGMGLAGGGAGALGSINLQSATINVAQATINVQQASFGGPGGGAAAGPGAAAASGGAPGAGGIGGGGGLLGQAAGAYGIYRAMQAASELAGVGTSLYASGGDLTAGEASRQTISAIPGLGPLALPILGPLLSQMDRLHGAQAAGRLTGTALPGNLGLGDSPTYLAALQGMALQGLGLPESMLERFRERPGLGTVGQYGVQIPNPRYVDPQVRAPILDAFTRARQDPYAIGSYGMGDIAEGFGATEAPLRLAQLALTRGDFATARVLFGYEQDPAGILHTNTQQQGLTASGLAIQRIQSAQDLDAVRRQTLVASGLTAGGQGALGGLFRSTLGLLTDQGRQIQTQLGYAQQNLAEGRRLDDPASMLAAQQRIQDLEVERGRLALQRANLGMEQAETPLTTATRAGLSRSSFAIDVLGSMPGAFGNLRGAYQQQVTGLEEAIRQVQGMREQQRQGGNLTPEADLRYQERLQDLGRQQAGAFNAFSYGWQDRLISTVVGHPGNFNLNARVPEMAAVMSGAFSPFLGTTGRNLPYFLRQSWLSPPPVSGVPGYQGPLPGDGPGVHGPIDPFSAAGGYDAGAGPNVVSPAAAAAAAAGALPRVFGGGGRGAAPVRVEGEVRVVMEDPQGRHLGTGRGRVTGNLGYEDAAHSQRERDDQFGRGSRQY